jgi:hypothetical protein
MAEPKVICTAIAKSISAFIQHYVQYCISPAPALPVLSNVLPVLVNVLPVLPVHNINSRIVVPVDFLFFAAVYLWGEGGTKDTSSVSEKYL